MDPLVLGNLVSLAGSVVMVLVGLIKSKKGILAAQCLMFALLAAGNLILGGVAGAVVDGVSILRNVLCFFIPFTVGWKAGFIGLFVLTAFLPGLLGWTGGLKLTDLLPVVGSGVFTWCLDARDGIVLKLAIIFGQLMWTVYDFTIRNYTALAFDLMTVVSNGIGIWMLRRDRNKKSGG